MATNIARNRAPAKPFSLAVVLTNTLNGAFFGFCVGVVMVRGGQDIWANYPLVRAFAANNHITNVVFSALIMYCGISYLAVRRQYSRIAALASLVILLNIGIESGHSFFNVPDPLDAVAGILGTAIVVGLTLIGIQLGSYSQPGVGHNMVKSLKPLRLIIGLCWVYMYLAVCVGVFLYGYRINVIQPEYSFSFSLAGMLGVTALGYFAVRQQLRNASLVLLCLAIGTSVLAAGPDFGQHIDAFNILAMSAGVAGASAACWVSRRIMTAPA